MREIKFRAWRKDIEVMEDVREMVWDNNGLKKQTGEQFLNIVGFREFESYTGAGNLKNVVIMQFTGLTDVNGDEIYEGDIVDIGVSLDRKTKSYISVVQYDDEMGCFKVEHPSIILLGNCEKLKVIGNIYENKDLLKEND